MTGMCRKGFFWQIKRELHFVLELLGKIFLQVLLLFINAYQRFVSPAFAPRCRFVPTCSTYAAQSLKKYGLLGGFGRAALRVARCHPFCKGGYDPP